MKFSCERCGKKYATAETPAPGRVYKIKCKACGHLIVVKASAGAAPTATTEMRSPTAVAMPAAGAAQHELHAQSTPDVQLEIGPPEPADAAIPPPAAYGRSSDSTQEVSVAGLSPASGAEQLGQPPGDGYVDLFADPPKEPERPQDDPFLAAARASLPDNYGASAAAPDPFAPLRDELSRPPPVSAPPPALGHAPTTTPKIPHIPRPPQQKSTLPLVLIGAGALVLVGILAFVLLGGKGSLPAAAQPAPARQVQAPVAPPAPNVPAPPAVAAAPAVPAPAPVAPAAAPPAPPKSAPPKSAKSDDRRSHDRAAKEARDREAREAREREKAAREARARAEREQKDRDRKARDERARDERLARDQRARADREARDREARERQRRDAEKVASANLPEEEAGLSQEAIQKVLSATRRAFENCILTASSSGEVKLDGRRVMLRLNIQTSGAVTYPTLDDVTLNGTELGGCLKSASRLMVFPKFKGDTMHVEVPLVLGK